LGTLYFHTHTTTDKQYSMNYNALSIPGGGAKDDDSNNADATDDDEG
jgi:hypothetical protein